MRGQQNLSFQRPAQRNNNNRNVRRNQGRRNNNNNRRKVLTEDAMNRQLEKYFEKV